MDEKECIKFKDYLRSPYFNTNENLLDFFDSLIKYLKIRSIDFKQDDFLETCGNLNENTFKSYLGSLKKEIERFIVVESINENESDLLILKNYLYRSDGKFFKNKLKTSRNRLNNSVKNIEFYHYQYGLERSYDSYIKAYEDKRFGDANMQATSNALEIDFIIKKLFYLILMHNRQNITKYEYDYGNKKMVDHYFLNKKVIKDPFMDLLYQAYMVLTGSNKKSSLAKLKQRLRDNNQKVTKELIYVITMIVNNNLKNLLDNKEELDKELFEFHYILLNQGYAHKANGKISFHFYKNFLLNCLELEKYDFAEEFIEEYKEKLSTEEEPGNIYNYCKALQFVYTNKPENAQELISFINFKDNLLKFDLRCLEIMTHYDRTNYSILDNLILNMNMALLPERAKLISKENKIIYKNFYTCLKKMHQCVINMNTERKDVLKISKFISDTNRFPNKSWLIKRVNDLLNRY